MSTHSNGELSEVSSREDPHELAAALGLSGIAELEVDRFRVERRKFESMLAGPDGLQVTESFFRKIMEDTGTQISWPYKLKIGAKSKKDPHVSVAGRHSDIKIAKDMVLAVLETRSNRVTMKLDISYTDHSHIIGRGGLTIKQVMEETGCHIHFPDSNRSNLTEKNNQVSISGEMEFVEKARAKLRRLTPLIFSFELPLIGVMQADLGSVTVSQLEEKYNVKVLFRTRARLHATLVMVKGCEWELANVKEATLLLMKHLCHDIVDQICIQMSMDISPHLHPIVLGKHSTNLKMIMLGTKTQIMFPDATDPNIPPLKRSSVTITGNINNVYMARQQLVGSLPLSLIFDLPGDTVLDMETINQLMLKLDVLINVRHKSKHNTLSVSIRGVERNASKIYEARKLLMKLNEPSVHADIPDTYLVPKDVPIFGVRTDSQKIPSRITEAVSPPANFGSRKFLSSGSGSSSPTLISPIPWAYPPMLPLQHSLVSQHLMPHNSMLSGMSCSSGYASLSNSTMSIGSDNCKVSSSCSPRSSPAFSPRQNTSPMQDVSPNNSGLGNLLMGLVDCPENKDTCERKDYDLQSHPTYDYEQKRTQAAEAIQKQIGTSLRIPTSNWAGYGFSQSSPSPKTCTTSFFQESECLDPWKQTTPLPSLLMPPSNVDNYTLGASNYLDSTPAFAINQITSTKAADVASLLTLLGLEKYIRAFTNQEIDMNVFPSLTDSDLQEIGVTPFGARKKILLAITEMNKRQIPFSAAPGAERKSSNVASSGIAEKW